MALIATLCVAAHGLVVGHYALVEHSRCAEHGALVHVDAHADHDQHDAASHALQADAVVQSSEAEHDDGHEHCATTSERRKAVCAVAPVVVARLVLASERPQFVASASISSRAVHWIAPKTSPPA